MNRLININELGLSKAAVEQLKAAVPPIKRGRKWLVRQDDLKEYLKRVRADVQAFAEEILHGN